MANLFHNAVNSISSTMTLSQPHCNKKTDTFTQAITLIGTSSDHPTIPRIYNPFALTAYLYSPIPIELAPAPKESPINPQKPSLLLCLPAELRNEIYKELLCPNTPSSNTLSTRESLSTIPTYIKDTLHPAILATCRTINQEATPLLYTQHIFHAHASLLTSLPHLLSPGKVLVSSSAIRRIRRWHITLRLDTDPRFTATQVTEAFSSAEFLRIHVWQSTYDGCDASVLKLFRGVRGVRVAVVTGCKDELARSLEGSMMREVGEGNRDDCVCEGGKERRRGDYGGRLMDGE